ncbi:MAG: hypothetical protein ACREFL_21290 [Stellaceae bacterium]
MRGINDRNFLNLWQMVHRATRPSLDQCHWQVGDVDWRTERHSFSGAAYASALDVHLLSRARGGRTLWRLMVVAEYWWDENRAPLRSTIWARMASGDARAVIAWFREHEGERIAPPV